MKRTLRWYDYLSLNIYWFALTTRSQTLTPLIVPLLVQQFVGEGAKGTFVGQMRLWSLMIALLVQALMGMLSDRCMARWGRRRPFILVGTLGEVVVFVLIGFISGLEGMAGYWTLFVLYIFSMVSSNTAHAATQGLIPDLVPEEKRGLASGIKALLELPVPLIFTSFVIGRLVGTGNLWAALLALIGILVLCMLWAMWAPEVPLAEVPFALDWQPFLRLLLMTGVFAAVIWGMGALVNLVMGLSVGLASGLSVWITGVVGLVGMAVAVGLGVWFSVRIGVGSFDRRNVSFTWWVVNRLAFMVGSTNLAGFMLYFLQEKFDLVQEEAAGPASTVIMFVGVFILVTALPSGWLSDRFGKKLLVAVSGLLAAVGTAIVVLIPSMVALYVGGCVIGAGVGLFYSANWALGTEIVPQKQAGRYLGISNLAGAGAGAVGAYIGGPIGDSIGYTPLMAVYGVLFVLSIFALQGVRVYGPKEKVVNAG